MRFLSVAGISVLGTLIRVSLFQTDLPALLLDYPDYTTPISSIRSVQEALHLVSTGHSAYAADVFHAPPFILIILRPILASHALTQAFFIALDLAIAWLLYATTHALQRSQEGATAAEMELMAQMPAGMAQDRYMSVTLNKVDFRNGLTVDAGGLSRVYLPLTVFGFYFLSPYTILGCIAMNTDGPAKLGISAAIYSSLQLNPLITGVMMAFAVALKPSNAVLALPVAMQHGRRRRRDLMAFWLSFGMAGIGLMQVAVEWTGMNRLDLVNYGYLRMCSVPDLRPNVGVWWYFFTETFERFREYFLLVFNVHPFVYVLPLCLNLSHRPIFLAQYLHAIFSIFVPYPDIPGITFALSLFLMHPLTIIRVRGLFVLLIGIVIPSLLMPLMWHMWIYAGTGNANFYYFQNLLFLMSVCLLVAQVLKATVSRDKLLKAYRKHNGTKAHTS